MVEAVRPPRAPDERVLPLGVARPVEPAGQVGPLSQQRKRLRHAAAPDLGHLPAAPVPLRDKVCERPLLHVPARRAELRRLWVTSPPPHLVLLGSSQARLPGHPRLRVVRVLEDDVVVGHPEIVDVPGGQVRGQRATAACSHILHVETALHDTRRQDGVGVPPDWMHRGAVEVVFEHLRLQKDLCVFLARLPHVIIRSLGISHPREIWTLALDQSN
mmetsp:Transcript_95688/g.249225  ORF Transcript_95688/g.249225 Transcript_95688/m.249225 type:complete len:216 (-) Transcript_95688:569-1216(-)